MIAIQQRRVRIKICLFQGFIAVGSMVSLAEIGEAQMGGAGAPGNGAGNVPLFNEPKFRDRVYESGGPQIIDTKSGKLITAVTIEGNRAVSEHKILSHMESRVDRIYDKDIFSRDLGELHRTGLFDNIVPSFQETPESIQIRLVVKEKPLVSKVTFHGNEAIDDRTLAKHCGLEIGDPTGPSAVTAARSRLVEYYRDQGFNNADVRIVSGGKLGEREIIFEISEGEVERIWSIDVVGNKDFSTELLKARIKSNDARSGIAAYIMNKASKETLDEDRDRLLNYYRRLGYFDARVDYALDYDDTGKWMYVTFVVSEGKPYIVRNIEVAGNQYYSTAEIQPLFKMKANEPFNLDHKISDERLIRDIYGEKGFIFADITGQIKYLPDHQVDILYTIAEGDIYRASDVRVHVEGDGHTQSNVILTKMGRIRPGSLLSSVEMERAERLLGASAIFSTSPQEGGPPRIEVVPPDQVEDDR